MATIPLEHVQIVFGQNQSALDRSGAWKNNGKWCLPRNSNNFITYSLMKNYAAAFIRTHFVSWTLL